MGAVSSEDASRWQNILDIFKKESPISANRQKLDEIEGITNQAFGIWEKLDSHYTQTLNQLLAHYTNKRSLSEKDLISLISAMQRIISRQLKLALICSKGFANATAIISDVKSHTIRSLPWKRKVG